MKFEKKYTIVKGKEWNSFVAHSIDDLYVAYSDYPNILEANSHTHSQIDYLTNVTPGERPTGSEKRKNYYAAIPEMKNRRGFVYI